MQAVDTDVGEGYSCTPDQAGIYFVKWAGDNLDRLKFEAIDDQCATRKVGMQWGNWTSASP